MPTINTFFKDQPVTIKFSTMAGVVAGAKIDENDMSIQYLVSYTDDFGEPQQRYFTFDQLQAA